MLTSKVLHISEGNANVGIVALSAGLLSLGAHFMQLPDGAVAGEPLPKGAIPAWVNPSDLAVQVRKPVDKETGKRLVNEETGEELEFTWWTLRIGAQ